MRIMRSFALPEGARLLPQPADLTSNDIFGLCILRLVSFDVTEGGATRQKHGWCVGRIVRGADAAHPNSIRVCWCNQETAFFELQPDMELYLPEGISRSDAPLYTWVLFTMQPPAVYDA
jgi:hypothetical protein